MRFSLSTLYLRDDKRGTVARTGTLATMGRNHVRVYTELKDVDDVYLYDVDGTAARRMSEQYGEGVLVSDSITSLLDTVDMVSICNA